MKTPAGATSLVRPTVDRAWVVMIVLEQERRERARVSVLLPLPTRGEQREGRISTVNSQPIVLSSLVLMARWPASRLAMMNWFRGVRISSFQYRGTCLMAGLLASRTGRADMTDRERPEPEEQALPRRGGGMQSAVSRKVSNRVQEGRMTVRGWRGEHA